MGRKRQPSKECQYLEQISRGRGWGGGGVIVRSFSERKIERRISVESCFLALKMYAGDVQHVPCVSNTLRGCGVFATFLFCFKANLSEYGSYLLHISMLQYIYKHHLFASFAHTCFKIFHIQAILACEYSHSSKYLLANLRIQANIRHILPQII